MKHIPVLLILAFALSLCNLTGKKAGLSNSNSATGGEAVDHPQPTAAQIQALAGGQTVNWEQQGITWTLPKGWSKLTVESKQFNYGAPGNAAFIIASISPMDENFPTDISLKAFYDGANTRKKNGEVDELHYLELDGLKGVEFRDDIRLADAAAGQIPTGTPPRRSADRKCRERRSSRTDEIEKTARSPQACRRRQYEGRARCKYRSLPPSSSACQNASMLPTSLAG